MKRLYALLLICAVQLGIAQPAAHQYTTKWVNSENGLKQLIVRSCIPDDDGFVWIGTELGIYRYDGANLTQVKDTKYPALSKQRIIRMGKDMHTGKIYFVTNPECKLYAINHNVIEQVTVEKLAKAIFTSNEICFTESDSLMKKVFSAEHIQKQILDYTSVTFQTASLTQNFFYLPQYDHLIAYNKNGEIRNFDLKCSSGMVLLQFGEDILVADQGKITPISEGKIINKKISVDEKIQSYLRRSLTNLSDLEILGSKDRYYLKYKGGIYQIVYQNNHLRTEFLFKAPAADITSITKLEDEGIYLIGTKTEGMAIVKPILFNTVLFDENKLNKSINYCYAVAAVSKNKWYSASGWSFNPETRKATPDQFLADFRNTRFLLPVKNKLYFHAKNNLWNVNTRKNDYDFTYPDLIQPIYSGFSGYAYYKNRLYITHLYMVYQSVDGQFKRTNGLNSKLAERLINGIYAVDNGLLIPTEKGLFFHSPEQGTTSLVKGLEHVNARYIKPVGKGVYWVGCYGDGLFLMHHGTVYKVTDKNIDMDAVHAIEEDSEGNLWISTNDGLLKTEKKSALIHILKRLPLACYKFSKEDGLLTNEFNGGGTHPSLQTESGILGFTSMKGFVWFKPTDVRQHRFIGKILLNNLVVNNTDTIIRQNNKYQIPSSADVLSFNFSYGYYYNRENLTIAYRFEDQDHWTEIKGNSFQMARYRNGAHTLQLKISTHSFSNDPGITQTFRLDFEARFYETFWFWGLSFLLFASFIYISYQVGAMLRRKNEIQLKARINEKTAELRETVYELEHSRSTVAQSLREKEVLLKEVHHRVKNNLQLIISMLNIQARRKNYIDIEEFLQKSETRITTMALIHRTLYQSEDSLDKINFQLYLEGLAQSISDTFENNDGRIHIDIQTQNTILNLSTAIPLGLIINELMTNSLKHAFPDNRQGVISIHLQRIASDRFELIMGDNGIGFRNDKRRSKSFGLELISLLAQQLKAEVRMPDADHRNYVILFDEIDIRNDFTIL
ncbi:histidine kinase dimerization/phosphoacceptor domain -containing protein [Flavobacterium sp.]|uniref:histidine kinase dimerization/phosphoacceptor domain -containing protein n=1 Tax=Flavobacterium sp. TaxID=239 RepID=UPI00261D9823|nr:histidine kinase dimerization/phosphoacceptor domain -containing protein [Flavobacterium sp.]